MRQQARLLPDYPELDGQHFPNVHVTTQVKAAYDKGTLVFFLLVIIRWSKKNVMLSWRCMETVIHVQQFCDSSGGLFRYAGFVPIVVGGKNAAGLPEVSVGHNAPKHITDLIHCIHKALARDNEGEATEDNEAGKENNIDGNGVNTEDVNTEDDNKEDGMDKEDEEDYDGVEGGGEGDEGDVDDEDDEMPSLRDNLDAFEGQRLLQVHRNARLCRSESSLDSLSVTAEQLERYENARQLLLCFETMTDGKPPKDPRPAEFFKNNLGRNVSKKEALCWAHAFGGSQASILVLTKHERNDLHQS